MKKTVEEIEVEVVDDKTTPHTRGRHSSKQRMVMVTGWRAALIAAPLLIAVLTLLVAIGAMLAAAALAGGVLLGTGWATRRILFPQRSNRPQIGAADHRINRS